MVRTLVGKVERAKDGEGGLAAARGAENNVVTVGRQVEHLFLATDRTREGCGVGAAQGEASFVRCGPDTIPKKQPPASFLQAGHPACLDHAWALGPPLAGAKERGLEAHSMSRRECSRRGRSVRGGGTRRDGHDGLGSPCDPAGVGTGLCGLSTGAAGALCFPPRQAAMRRLRRLHFRSGHSGDQRPRPAAINRLIQ